MDAGRSHRHRTTSTPTNDRALTANAASGPAAATSAPPIAGPTAREAFMDTPLSATAAGTSACGTSSVTTACQAGLLRANPTPRANPR